jgi:hypothetical protein
MTQLTVSSQRTIKQTSLVLCYNVNIPAKLVTVSPLECNKLKRQPANGGLAWCSQFTPEYLKLLNETT